MINLQVLLDQEQIRLALQKDDLYKGCYSVEDIKTCSFDVQTTGWLQVLENNVPIGLAIIKEVSSPLFAFHGGVYKEFRGPKTPEYMKETMNILTKAGLTLLMSQKDDNKLVKRLMNKLDLNKVASVKTREGLIHLYIEVN